MDINLKNKFDTIETGATSAVNTHMNETGTVVNAELNNTMNNYRNQQITLMETELVRYEEELQELYGDQPVLIATELAKKREALTIVMDDNIEKKLQTEMTAAQNKMDSALQTKMNSMEGELKSMLSNPFGDIGKTLTDSTKIKIGGIEFKLGKVEDVLGNKTAKKIVNRATRNGTTAVTVNTDPTIKSTTETPPHLKVATASSTTTKKAKGTKHKIDDKVKNKAMDKVNNMTKNAADKLNIKMHSKIDGKMKNKVSRMIGSDIKWLR